MAGEGRGLARPGAVNPESRRRGGGAACGPLPALLVLPAERPDPRARLVGWQEWLDAQLLRREAEAVVAGRAATAKE